MQRERHTGMCVPYEVRLTPDKGRGLFAETPIAKGTTVWRHVEGQFLVFDEQSLEAHLAGLQSGQAVQILEHIHCMHEFPEFMVLVLDDGVLTNHADEPNLIAHTDPAFASLDPARSKEDVSKAILGGFFTLVAARDIEAGEELTLDYNQDTDDPHYFTRLCDQYGVKWDWL